MKLDKKDQQLIFELDQNSRQSINSIAKKTKLSRDVVNYRIKQLEKKKIINGYFALIDYVDEFIFLDNVLEHVLNPFELLENLNKIISDDGVLVVDVPNDFSLFQKYLAGNNYIDRDFWICPPDHLSYFNKDGLINLAKDTGWKINKVISDYPIELDLLSLNSNYVNNPSVGKASHRKRIEFENFIHSVSVEKTNQFYESLIDLGLGRNIIGFFSKV